MNFLKQVIGTKTKIYIVMEYVTGGRLLDKMVRIINNLSTLKYAELIIIIALVFLCSPMPRNWMNVRLENYSSNLLMLLTTAITKEFITEISR